MIAHPRYAGTRVMSKNKKKEDESKQLHIDGSTIIGIMIIAAITKIIEEMVGALLAGIRNLADLLLQRLVASVLKVWIDLIAWQFRLSEWLYEKWYLWAALCLFVASVIMIWYVYKWILERTSLKRSLAWKEKLLKRAIEREERDRLNQKYINSIGKYKAWTAEWKNGFQKRILITGGALVFFLGLGAFQNLQPALRHSMETEVAADNGIAAIINEIRQEPENKNWIGDTEISFILEDPDIVWELSSGLRQYVFYVTLDGMADNGEKVSDHLQVISDSDRVSNAGKRTEIENGVIDRASRLEEEFLKDIKAARQYRVNGNDLKWRDTIPSSATLDDIIETRSDFWSEDILRDKCDGELCFLLANDFQQYALEFAGQGGKISTVVYCYAWSILWTERAMSYSDITEENEKLYYDYLRARYKDISDYLLKNLTTLSENKELNYYITLQKKAEIIYNIMLRGSN